MRVGLALSGADVAALAASTDGWAAGLRLATLFLRGGADASSLLGRLCGANDVIGEFLAESVLDTLEPEIADFMLATSITERTCGALASALSEQPRGLAMLEEVARRGLFLHRVDDDPGWFRITSCSPNSYAVDLHATLPSGVGDCTARRRHGSPNMATSTRPSTMRSRSTTRNLPLTWSSATRHVCSRSQK